MHKLLVALLFSLTFICGCVPATTPVHYAYPQYDIANLHKTVYLDHNLSEQQENAIIDALHEWEYATKNMVHFTIKLHTSNKDYAVITDTKTNLIITNTTAKNTFIVRSDIVLNKHDQYTLGLYNIYNHIPEILMVESRMTMENYGIVALHELGHAFLLEHTKEHNAIMHAGVDTNIPHLTSNDLVAFCNLYWCKAK